VTASRSRDASGSPLPQDWHRSESILASTAESKVLDQKKLGAHHSRIRVAACRLWHSRQKQKGEVCQVEQSCRCPCLLQGALCWPSAYPNVLQSELNEQSQTSLDKNAARSRISTQKIGKGLHAQYAGSSVIQLPKLKTAKSTGSLRGRCT
jgi:hypothetical protein